MRMKARRLQGYVMGRRAYPRKCKCQGMRMGPGGKRRQLRSGLWTKQVAMRTPSGTGRRSKTGSRKLLIHVTRLAPGLTWWDKLAP